MILELHREGVSISDIARRIGLDRKTVRKYIARGLEPPVYSPRPPRPLSIEGYASYLRERVAAFPELTGRRLWREIHRRANAGLARCNEPHTTPITEFTTNATPP